jgi:hypothetical protein
MLRRELCLLALGTLLCSPLHLSGQQVVVGTPLFGVNDSFFEQFQLGWGFRGGGSIGPLSFGGLSPALPPFGNFDPASGAGFGVARRWGNGEFFFNLSAAQGRRTSMTMTAPSMTLTNGVPGLLQDVSVRPFVTGLVPIVGGDPWYPYYPVYSPFYPVYPPYAVGPLYPLRPWYSVPQPGIMSSLVEKLQRLRHEAPLQRPFHGQGDEDLVLGEGERKSSIPLSVDGSVSTAERGDIGVAEIRLLQEIEAAEQRHQINRLIAEAQDAERSGRIGIARVRYRQAAAKADGDHRQQLLQLAESLPQK